ncbi:hypothetical protein THAOC_24704 [Thalassiosira oceanica]|uniref:Uncharacterized protein n=1 Tax=Thalassiosira oceanica TaxID=159749 RepID=K0RR57_THAOC|nr:hypothetical protein THAOC_24704 [Thalassiosira oceanica]|eukprot:EJK55555.1 hypothetical protein THAOC_24704 [Thalassiosira oceanica]
MKSDDNSMSMCSVFARDRLRRTRAATKRVPLALRAKWIALASVFGLSFWNAITSVSLSSPGHSDYFDHPPCVTSANAATDKQLHIALALSGREPGVFDEFEAALKSVLLNAPFERSLFVHIFADSNAYEELDGVLIRTQVTSWERWRFKKLLEALPPESLSGLANERIAVARIDIAARIKGGVVAS